MQRKVPEISYICQLADARANENSPELYKSYYLHRSSQIVKNVSVYKNGHANIWVILLEFGAYDTCSTYTHSYINLQFIKMLSYLPILYRECTNISINYNYIKNHKCWWIMIKLHLFFQINIYIHIYTSYKQNLLTIYIY